MKIIKALIVLLIISAPAMAQISQDVVTIGEFDSIQQGFSFRSGGLISVNGETDSLSIKIDFIFDMPNGLGMNNRELDGWFSGDGIVQDLGSIPIEKKVDPLKDKFMPYLVPEEIIPGHTYLMKLAETDTYGRIKIVEFEPDNNLLTFEWVYPDSYNSF